MKDNKRNTQLANEILMELITTYRENQIRIFLATINKVLAQHYAIKRDTESEDDMDTLENYSTLEVDIPLDFYKEYGAKGEYTIKKWKEIIKSIMIPIVIKENGTYKAINIIDEIEYDYNSKNFHVVFDEKYFEYVLLLEDKGYTIIDLEEIKKLDGKYEIGIYLAMWQFIEKGKRMFTIEGCKNYFDYSGNETKELMRQLRKSVENVNNKMGYKINVNTVVYNKAITNINLEFPKGRRKI